MSVADVLTKLKPSPIASPSRMRVSPMGARPLSEGSAASTRRSSSRSRRRNEFNRCRARRPASAAVRMASWRGAERDFKKRGILMAGSKKAGLTTRQAIPRGRNRTWRPHNAKAFAQYDNFFRCFARFVLSIISADFPTKRTGGSFRESGLAGKTAHIAPRRPLTQREVLDTWPAAPLAIELATQQLESEEKKCHGGNSACEIPNRHYYWACASEPLYNALCR